MTLLRNILSDLIEKHLWPLAVVLVAALFLAPSALTKPAADQSGDVPPVSTTIAAEPVARVQLDTSVSLEPLNHSDLGRNPFIQQYATTVPDPGQLVSPGTSGGASTKLTGEPSSGSPSVKTTPTGGSKNGHAKKKAPSTGGTVTLRFGESGNLRTLDNVDAFTPLPSQAEPFFVFMGLKPGDDKTAVFLISSDVKATGDGTCQPEVTTCETIEMVAGNTEFFDLTTPEGTKQYQLDLVRISN